VPAEVICMPELPEVETIRQDLRRQIIGKKIADERKAESEAWRLHRYTFGNTNFKNELLKKRIPYEKFAQKQTNYAPSDSADGDGPDVGLQKRIYHR
jgi:hypothetical protein